MQRTLIGLVLVFVVFAGISGIGWYIVKDRIRLKQEYLLSADKIIVSLPPDWIPNNFVADVLKSSGLNRTGSLLDKTLPQKLTEAFAAYPWVETVEQVIPRYPSGAEIKLSYRVPVALVEVPRHGTFPVDRSGVLLPSEYLLNTISDRQNDHLVIQGIQSTPLGAVGTSWGDPLVQTASQLAAALTDVAEPLKLARIIPAKETTPNGERIVCWLKTAAGMEIHWGVFYSNDPKIEAKKKRLWELNEQFRSLDNVPIKFQPIDLSKE